MHTSAVLLVYATHRTINFVALAILIGTYQLVNDIHACIGNASVHILHTFASFYTRNRC